MSETAYMYTTEELISFGNYLLSEFRESMVDPEYLRMVHHADVENWKVGAPILVEDDPKQDV